MQLKSQRNFQINISGKDSFNLPFMPALARGHLISKSCIEAHKKLNKSFGNPAIMTEIAQRVSNANRRIYQQKLHDGQLSESSELILILKGTNATKRQALWRRGESLKKTNDRNRDVEKHSFQLHNN